MQRGLIQIYTGEGKGKTTAAIGQAIRALGRGLKVAMVQLVKCEESGEAVVLKDLPGFLLYKFNSQQKFIWNMNKDEIALLKEETEKGLVFAKEIIGKGEADILILDEVFAAINNQLVIEDELVSILKIRPNTMEIILTGRGASEKIIALADLVTEMKKIKHPFDKGLPARDGIEK